MHRLKDIKICIFFMDNVWQDDTKKLDWKRLVLHLGISNFLSYLKSYKEVCVSRRKVRKT